MPLVPGEPRLGRAGGAAREHYRASYVAKGYGKTASSNPDESHLTEFTHTQHQCFQSVWSESMMHYSGISL